MSTLVFDIETVSRPWAELSKSLQQRLLTNTSLKYPELVTEEECIEQILSRAALSPFTGKVIALSVYDSERSEGVVYIDTPEEIPKVDIDHFAVKVVSESELLALFWEGVASYEEVATFNGRSFDVPFLWHRSAAHGVTPSKNLLSHRYLERQQEVRHIDLLDQFTFYNAMDRKPSLVHCCDLFGVEHKAPEYTGADVASLVADKQYGALATYAAADALATAELLDVWQRYYEPLLQLKCDIL